MTGAPGCTHPALYRLANKNPAARMSSGIFLHCYGSAYAFTITCLGQTSTQAPQPVHLS